MVVILGF